LAEHYSSFKYCYTPTPGTQTCHKKEGKKQAQAVDTTNFSGTLVKISAFKRHFLYWYSQIPVKTLSKS